MPMVTVNNVELNYQLEGDGPETIVLINGLADDLTTWFAQMDDLLCARSRCAAPMPRPGRSARACSSCGRTWRRSWACRR
jgi:pimeloyl-ACP methyl ester carboxylesterase